MDNVNPSDDLARWLLVSNAAKRHSERHQKQDMGEQYDVPPNAQIEDFEFVPIDSLSATLHIL